MPMRFALGTNCYHELAWADAHKTVCGKFVGKMKLVARGTDCYPYAPCKACAKLSVQSHGQEVVGSSPTDA